MNPPKNPLLDVLSKGGDPEDGQADSVDLSTMLVKASINGAPTFASTGLEGGSLVAASSGNLFAAEHNTTLRFLQGGTTGNQVVMTAVPETGGAGMLFGIAACFVAGILFLRGRRAVVG